MILKNEAPVFNYTEIAHAIKAASRIVVLSGAGISTASGIPDFRTEGSGLWSTVEPMEFASLSAFRTQPEKFFAWARPLFQNIANAIPNPAHLALAAMEQVGLHITVITQNIDGLHQEAGSTRVIEVHGSINSLTCTCCFRKFSSTIYMGAFLENQKIPYCPDCNNILKPDAILFEEQLPHQPWREAQTAVNECDVMLVTGSSLEVLPIAGLPMKALHTGAQLIVLNNAPTYIDASASHVIYEDLAIALPKIADELQS